MNFIWLTSSPHDVPVSVLALDNVVVLDIVAEPLRAIQQTRCPVTVIVELEQPGQYDLLRELSATAPVWIYLHPDLQAPTVTSTLSLIKAGAAHIAATLDEILQAIRTAPRAQIKEMPAGALVGASRSTRTVSASIAMVANSRCNVLIEGETGTGKEVVAREIHTSGNRSRAPWVAVNCGAIPDTLLEAELFGHARGAFTGAVQARTGKFEAANHGTIFLDEIGDMPLAIQAKLLRVLQEREIERLGGNERIRLDIRVIAATNANLAARVREGQFRQDLYYRLNVFRIALDPLHQRQADIPVLARHFLSRVCSRERIAPKTLDPATVDLLLVHDWPGNARELENVMETANIVSGARSTIYPADIRFEAAVRAPQSAGEIFPARSSGTALPAEGLDYQQALHAFERDLLAQAIARTRGNKSAAADLLRLKRTTLSARMRVLETKQPRLVA